MERRRTARFTVAVSLGFIIALPGLAQERSVLVADIEGAITPVIADYLADAVDEAVSGGHAALVVTVDTPGGLDVSMREIVQSFLNAPIPVVVYVSPSGARAASAGTYITMAGHVAAMAPGTAIGAATPVDLQGGEITDKIINDAVAFAVSVAEQRGRDVEFAEDAIREGRSITSREALEIGVVDVVADSLDDLLDEIDGRRVEIVGGESVTLGTAGAFVERYELGTFRSILGQLADPNLAFVFLSIGTLAVIYEAANPGLGFAGIAGVILLILAFFSLSVLPVQGAGVALLVLAVALFVAEVFVPGVGVLAAGGAVALLLGGLFLFEGSIGVSPGVLWPSAVVMGGASVLAGRAVIRAQRRPATSGPSTLVGRIAAVADADGMRGQVFVDGAWWEVVSSVPLQPGSNVRVAAVEGLHLVVEPAEVIHDT